MCVGVTSGLAGMNFSGSFRAFGASRARERIPMRSVMNPTKSFVEK